MSEHIGDDKVSHSSPLKIFCTRIGRSTHSQESSGWALIDVEQASRLLFCLRSVSPPAPPHCLPPSLFVGCYANIRKNIRI
jgi:hypothetical protein